MPAYYYISSSLPYLSDPADTPLITGNELLDLCRRFMLPDDYEDIASVSLDPQTSGSGGLTLGYHAWEASLRNDLSRLRAQQLELKAKQFLRDRIPVLTTAAVALEAMKQATPLEAELYLDHQRWSFIENLACGHFFDMDFFRGYRLKLLIKERQSQFDADKGFDVYRGIQQLVIGNLEDYIHHEN